MKKRSGPAYLKLLALISLLVPVVLWAEAPVSDAAPAENNYYDSAGDPAVPLSQEETPAPSSYSAPAYNTGSTSSNSSASLLSKVAELQKEVQKLRGQLEVQSHQIQVLKEQQQAYYNDLDQRLTDLTQKKGKTQTLSLDDATLSNPSQQKTASSSSPAATPAIVPVSGAGNASSEDASYNAAYVLIEQKQFPQATSAMRTFLQNYPNGKYASNAHYWLGELLIAQNQNQEAITEFNVVINEYPDSNKVSAAMLKLGTAYVNLGDMEKAKAQFLKVESTFPGTTTAQLARDKLNSLNNQP